MITFNSHLETEQPGWSVLENKDTPCIWFKVWIQKECTPYDGRNCIFMVFWTYQCTTVEHLHISVLPKCGLDDTNWKDDSIHKIFYGITPLLLSSLTSLQSSTTATRHCAEDTSLRSICLCCMHLFWLFFLVVEEPASNTKQTSLTSGPSGFLESTHERRDRHTDKFDTRNRSVWILSRTLHIWVSVLIRLS